MRSVDVRGGTDRSAGPWSQALTPTDRKTGPCYPVRGGAGADRPVDRERSGGPARGFVKVGPAAGPGPIGSADEPLDHAGQGPARVGQAVEVVLALPARRDDP